MRRSFFLPRDSGLHALHPLTKLMLALCVILIGFLAPWASLPLLLFLFIVLPLSVWGKIARSLIRATLVVAVPFALSITLVQALFYPGATHVLFALGPFAVKAEGLEFAYGTAGRILLLAGAGLLLLLSTAPSDLMMALTERGMPRSIAYIVVAAIQLLPQMQARAAAILDAQRARGLEAEGSILMRVRAVIPLLSPLVFSALSDVDERAMALEARAFSSARPRTSFVELRDTRGQAIFRWALAGAALSVGIVELWAR